MYTRQVEFLVSGIVPSNVLRMLLLLMHLMHLRLVMLVRRMLSLFFCFFLVYFLLDRLEQWCRVIIQIGIFVHQKSGEV